jgi:predicted amidohydrolase YtcJ
MIRILHNAQILTNASSPQNFSAAAIENGRIRAVGTDAEILAGFGTGAEKLNMRGQTIWPGLTDAHLHLEHYSVSLAMIDCETATKAECLQRVAERARVTPPGAWIRGHGWNQNVWPEGFGSAQELDAAAPQNPVYLSAKSLHAGWANTAALRLAGLQDSSPDPLDGKLQRDEAGRLTGILLEAAMELVEKTIPPLSVSELVDLLRIPQQKLWMFGLTGVHDFDQARCFSALQILDLAGELRLRVVKSIPLPLLTEAAALGLRSGFGSDFLRIGSVKLFSDGALGPHTAAMLQPYEDDSQNTGILFLDNEQIYEHGQQAALAGISMAIHAIGDRANHEVLRAYAQLRIFEEERGLSPARNRIEHVQILHPEDYRRLADLDVIASVQPIHATSDMLMADRFWGPRSQGAYAYQTLLQNGTRLALGSDAPVESPNPFLGLHAAVTRRRPDGTPGDQGWYPDQRLSLSEALAGYTTGPAYAAGLEKTLGQLNSGYHADLIVLPRDPYSIPAQELHSIHPSAVMVAGEWVWQESYP